MRAFGPLVAALAIGASFFPERSLGQSTPTVVQRYDDADEFLPQAERRNSDGVRLYLRQQSGEETFDVLTPRNVLVKIVGRIPEGARKGVLLFTGGSGVLSIGGDNKLDRSFAFLNRTRDTWWDLGFATFVVDAPSDKLDKSGIDSRFRAGSDYAKDLVAVIDAVKKRFSEPLFAVGISNGAISVANAASRATGALSGYVLISPAHYRNSGGELIAGAQYDKPVWIVASHNDECSVSPSREYEALARNISAPSVDFQWIDGGKRPISGPCGPFSAHSLFGIEGEAIRAIAARMK
jgi:predicted esterase